MLLACYKKVPKDLARRITAGVTRWWDDGPYSHVELVFSDGTSASSSLSDGGVRFKQISYDSGWDFYTVPDSFASEEFARTWFQTHNGCKYDILGNFGFVLRRGTQGKREWFCSEAIAASLGISDPWRLTPNGLAAVVKSVKSPSGR